MRVQILRLFALLMLSLEAHADESAETTKSTMPTPPPGVPAAGPDSAPVPEDLDSPAYDAIRQRCALAIDRRACIEAARDPSPARSGRETPR